ncbi:MAG: hypothetical protein LBF65_02355 [Holosporales bacterium]|jgi:hypothetical protein|nr:hypothetical protein [Holosporales bacterium]
MKILTKIALAISIMSASFGIQAATGGPAWVTQLTIEICPQSGPDTDDDKTHIVYSIPLCQPGVSVGFGPAQSYQLNLNSIQQGIDGRYYVSVSMETDSQGDLVYQATHFSRLPDRTIQESRTCTLTVDDAGGVQFRVFQEEMVAILIEQRSSGRYADYVDYIKFRMFFDSYNAIMVLNHQRWAGRIPNFTPPPSPRDTADSSRGGLTITLE